MRVAFLLRSFPVLSETFFVRQIVGLRELGHDVDIFADVRPPAAAPVHTDVLRHRLLESTSYVDCPENYGARLLSVLPRALTALARAPGLTARVVVGGERIGRMGRLRAIYRIAALSSGRGPYDVAHAHFGPVASDFRFARRVWDAPLVASFHGYDFSSWPRRYGPDVYRDLFATVDAVTGLNAYTMRRVRELGCPPEKLHKMPMGLDPLEFPFRERALARGEPVRLLTVGRMIEKKGMEFSIRAVGRLVRSHPDVRYEIVGDGPLRSTIEALVSELGLERVVVLHGARDASFVRDRMAAAHLFMLTSVTAASGDQEGQAVVLQEAQACGLPVVTTDHSGLPEAIDAGRSGLLVPERDVDALVDRLEHLVSHPDLWASMGRAGRAYVEARFDNRTLMRDLEGLYAELVERRRPELPLWRRPVGVSAWRAVRNPSGK